MCNIILTVLLFLYKGDLPWVCGTALASKNGSLLQNLYEQGCIRGVGGVGRPSFWGQI